VPLRKSVAADDALRPAVAQAVQPALRLAFLRNLADWLRRSGLTPAEKVHASELLALSILNDVFRYLVGHYCVEEQPGAMARCRAWSRPGHNADTTARALQELAGAFPPATCLRGIETTESFLAGGQPAWSHADATAA